MPVQKLTLATPMATATLVRKESLKCAVCRAAILIFGAMVVGITFYVLQGRPLLPTISNTWTRPPASYLSRYCVGTGCVIFQVVNLAMYRANQDTGKFAKAYWVNKLNLVVGFVAILCLSGVGAVCDSTIDSCRGLDSVHMMFAIPFFILYNMNMIILTCDARRKGILSRTSHCKLWAMVLISLFTKVRVLPPGFDFSQGLPLPNNTLLTAAVGGSSDITAVIEWTDVMIIILWTISYVSLRCPDFGLATVRLQSGAGKNGAPIFTANGQTQVLNRVSGFTLSMAFTALLLVMLLSTFVVEVFVTKAVPVPSVLGGNGTWPSESSLWVSAPGNWISRWCLVLAGALLMSYNTLVPYVLPSNFPKAVTCLSMLGAAVGSMALALSGCVDQYEDADEHRLFMTLTFGGLNAFSLLVSAVHTFNDKPRRCTWIVMILALCVTMARVFISTSTESLDSLNTTTNAATDTTNTLTSMFYLLQWMNTFALLLFLTYFTRVYMPSFEKLALAITYTASSSSQVKEAKIVVSDQNSKHATLVDYAAVEGQENAGHVVTACIVKEDGEWSE